MPRNTWIVIVYLLALALYLALIWFASFGEMILLAVPSVITFLGLFFWMYLLLRRERWVWYVLLICTGLTAFGCVMCWLFLAVAASTKEPLRDRLVVEWYVHFWLTGLSLVTISALLRDRPENWNT